MIEFKNVSKKYSSGTHALNGTTLSIDEGEFVFIVGASGAGKSTLLKLIMHEEVPSEGEVIVDGEVVNKLKRSQVPYLRRKMGIVFQDFRLIDKMNVFDNVAFAMRAIGEPPKEIKRRVEYILELVGLEDKAKRRPSEISGGEQQRVSLARALVNNPKIIIADEPTGNIDPKLSYEIMELLKEINKKGTTVLIVTHEKDLVKEFDGRVIEIEGGRVILDKYGEDAIKFAETLKTKSDIEKENQLKNDRINADEEYALISIKDGSQENNLLIEDDNSQEIDLSKYDALVEELEGANKH